MKIKLDSEYTHKVYGTSRYTDLEGNPLSEKELKLIKERTDKALKFSMKPVVRKINEN